ncbi:hypothetical protein V2H45_24915 [Tumidithrix elongata RA019]|uniref:Uncharacterized protein n=1 Tax=Tumidithrix elongata BACA0141 TaxID=2716417 RepID=A0AAW9QAG2_9CYAN|nr:hypothetical protein [Tumidithrix elongata RA019]
MSLNLLDLTDSPPEIQTLVIAGNYWEYLQWRRGAVDIKTCKYIESLEDIKGLHGFFVDLVCYGTYQRNPVYCSRQMQKLISESQSPFRAYVNVIAKSKRIKALSSQAQEVVFPFKFIYS